MNYIIIVYIFFGILPSITWLSYYLRKDMHPEPKRMLLIVFLLGAFSTVPVLYVQIGLANLLGFANLSPAVTAIVYWFLIIAFSEEFFKYLVVRIKVFSSPHLDEPLDIMLYMVVSALGFATLENILYLPLAKIGVITPLFFEQAISGILIADFIRFVGTTFLHALCSAVVGYFLALSFYDVKKKYIYIFSGIIIASLLHGIYDLSIMILNGYIKYVVSVVVILTLAFLVSSGFNKLRNMKSICKIK